MEPCCRVIRHTTLPLPSVVSRTKLNCTVAGRANEVVAFPALFSVWAELLSAAWLTVNVAPPVVTVKVAVAMLLLESITVITWLPVRPAGTVAYRMNCPELLTAAEDGAKLTIEPPTSTIRAAYGVNPLPMICTVDPAGPVAGLKVIVGGVTVKVADAVLPRVSVTTTVLAVERTDNGTAKLVETNPFCTCPFDNVFEVVVPAAAAIATPLTVKV